MTIKPRGDDGAFNFKYHKGTIPYGDWLWIQARAMRANPELRDSTSPAAIRRARSVIKQLRAAQRGEN